MRAAHAPPVLSGAENISHSLLHLRAAGGRHLCRPQTPVCSGSCRAVPIRTILLVVRHLLWFRESIPRSQVAAGVKVGHTEGGQYGEVTFATVILGGSGHDVNREPRGRLGSLCQQSKTAGWAVVGPDGLPMDAASGRQRVSGWVLCTSVASQQLQTAGHSCGQWLVWVAEETVLDLQQQPGPTLEAVLHGALSAWRHAQLR